MELSFTNRSAEMQELDAAAAVGGLVVMFGRRRVGKTRLLRHWLPTKSGLYSQAIEAATGIQLEQAMRDLGPGLKLSLVPRTWSDFFELLAMRQEPTVLCLDEFPYLAASDPSLPSVVQRWLDHQRPRQFTLVLAGSSTSAMNDCFLNRAAPLYQRARKLLQVRPMSYPAFCAACSRPPGDIESFTQFALVGGLPKYWEFLERKSDSLDLAETLYFGRSAFLEDEPLRLLRDEGIAGATSQSVMEAIGRGSEKPSEIAARLGTAQTNLGRVFQHLADVSLLHRQIPFGESPRTSKRTRLAIHDPALRFWYQVYSPHRTRWQGYDRAQKQKLLHDHAATVFEDHCRDHHAGAARYWEPGLEFDFVRESAGEAIVSEVNYRRLSPAERTQLEHQLSVRWQQSSLARKFLKVRFEILDARVLGAGFFPAEN